MAPEVIRHEKYSRSADVYSFAMILFELLTHQAIHLNIYPSHLTRILTRIRARARTCTRTRTRTCTRTRT